jgi:hypothetical protein
MLRVPGGQHLRRRLQVPLAAVPEGYLSRPTISTGPHADVGDVAGATRAYAASPRLPTYCCSKKAETSFLNRGSGTTVRWSRSSMTTSPAPGMAAASWSGFRARTTFAPSTMRTGMSTSARSAGLMALRRRRAQKEQYPRQPGAGEDCQVQYPPPAHPYRLDAVKSVSGQHLSGPRPRPLLPHEQHNQGENDGPRDDERYRPGMTRCYPHGLPPILDDNLFLRQMLQGLLAANDCGLAILRTTPWLTTAIHVACMTSYARGYAWSLRTAPRGDAARPWGLQWAALDQAGRRLRRFDAVPRQGHASMRRHGSILVRTPSEEVRSSPCRL